MPSSIEMATESILSHQLNYLKLVKQGLSINYHNLSVQELDVVISYIEKEIRHIQKQ